MGKNLRNAASAGLSADDMVAALERFSRFDLPKNVVRDVRDLHARFGRLRLERAPDGAAGPSLRIVSDDPVLLAEVAGNPLVKAFVAPAEGTSLAVAEEHRGEVKQSLVRSGWPVEDRAGYVDGGPLVVTVRDRGPTGRPFALRDYQHEAVAAFWREGSPLGGSGVVVLPCGAGKTIVGLAAMEMVSHTALVQTTKRARRRHDEPFHPASGSEPFHGGKYSTLHATVGTKYSSIIPVVFAGVYDPQAMGVTGKDSAGVSSKVPVTTVIKGLKTISNFTKLGVIINHSEKDTLLQAEEIKQLESKFGFQSTKYNVKRPGDSSKISGVDALFLTTSCSAMHCVDNITGFARKAKIPTATMIGGGEGKGVILTLKNEMPFKTAANFGI